MDNFIQYITQRKASFKEQEILGQIDLHQALHLKSQISWNLLFFSLPC